MADVSIIDRANHPAPKSYPLTGAQELLIKSVSASFDGTGAGGNYVPCVQIIDATGIVVGTYPLEQTVTAGASVDVSWFPGVNAPASTSGGGIQFDTNPQAGGYLVATVTDDGGTAPTGWPLDLQSTTLTHPSGGIRLQSQAAEIRIESELVGGNIQVSAINDELDLYAGGSGGMTITADNALVIDGGPTEIKSSQGNVLITPQANHQVIVYAGSFGGNEILILGAYAGADRLTVYDSGGNAIFQVDDDGSLHGKTGQTLTFDL